MNLILENKKSDGGERESIQMCHAHVPITHSECKCISYQQHILQKYVL